MSSTRDRRSSTCNRCWIWRRNLRGLGSIGLWTLVAFDNSAVAKPQVSEEKRWTRVAHSEVHGRVWSSFGRQTGHYEQFEEGTRAQDRRGLGLERPTCRLATSQRCRKGDVRKAVVRLEDWISGDQGCSHQSKQHVVYVSLSQGYRAVFWIL